MAKPDIVNEINRANIRALIDYTGSTARAARALGVTPRTIQRYITTGAQTRNPNAAVRAKLAAAPSTRRSTRVTYDGNIMVNGYERTRTIFWEYPPDTWAELSNLAALGDEDAVWEFIAHDYNVDEMEVIDGTIDIE